MNNSNRIWSDEVVPWICDMSMTVPLIFLLNWNIEISVDGDWCCHLVGSYNSARWKSVSKGWVERYSKRLTVDCHQKAGWEFHQKRWNDCIKEMEWHFGESWWLCSSEWIDDANGSLILANVGFGRCSNVLTVDLSRSAEGRSHQKRWKWLHQEYVNCWNKAGWWFVAESWK